MSKEQILAELPRLGRTDRREVWERLCQLEERDLLQGAEPTAEEKSMLDLELEEYQSSRDAGSSWEEVERRLASGSGA
jgi:hypothetical protein